MKRVHTLPESLLGQQQLVDPLCAVIAGREAEHVAHSVFATFETEFVKLVLLPVVACCRLLLPTIACLLLLVNKCK